MAVHAPLPIISAEGWPEQSKQLYSPYFYPKTNFIIINYHS